MREKTYPYHSEQKEKLYLLDMAVTNRFPTPLILYAGFHLERAYFDMKLHNHWIRTFPQRKYTVWLQQEKEKLRGLMLHKHAYTATGYENGEISELISLLSFMLNFIFQISSHSKISVMLKHS